MGFGFCTCHGRLARKRSSAKDEAPPKALPINKKPVEKFTSKPKQGPIKRPSPPQPSKSPSLPTIGTPADDHITLRRTATTSHINRNSDPHKDSSVDQPNENSIPSPSKKRWTPNRILKYVSNDGCWSNLMDYFAYTLIRIKVWFKKKEPDGLDKLTYDPFTGKPVKTGAEKSDLEILEETETEVKCLTYSAELHDALKYFWWAINCTGRLPFHVHMEDNTLTIKMEYCSTMFIINLVTCIVLWGVFIWLVVGHTLIIVDEKIPNRRGGSMSTTNVTTHIFPGQKRLSEQLPEYRMLRRYWVDLWFFYTTLFHLASVTTNQCIYGKDYAIFFKRWYKALDRSKVRVHESLREFYLILYGLVAVLVTLMVCLFISGHKFPAMFRTCEVILAGFMYPVTSDRNRMSPDGNLYFQSTAKEVLVFLLYCYVVIVSWQNSIIHLTFSRCFRNGIGLLNDRVRMVLLPLEEPQVGPNAVRITAQLVQDDYYHLTAAGMSQNKVFGFAIGSDMLWTLFTIFFEVMGLTFFGFDDPAHPEFLYRFHNTYEGTNIKQMDPAYPFLLNAVGHAVITGVRLWIVVWFPDLVFREAQIGYRYVTSKGLLLCDNALQRNFVRSMWLMTVPKFPIMITANSAFKLTRGMICALLASVATYYIFAMQAKSQLSRVNNEEWGQDIIELYKRTGRGDPLTDDA